MARSLLINYFKRIHCDEFYTFLSCSCNLFSCLRFSENILENIQITTDNPLIMDDVKFCIVTQIQKIKASLWQYKNQFSPGISWFSNAYAPYVLEHLSESSYAAVESWVELVNNTHKKIMEFRYPKPQTSRRRNVFKWCFCCFSE